MEVSDDLSDAKEAVREHVEGSGTGSATLASMLKGFREKHLPLIRNRRVVQGLAQDLDRTLNDLHKRVKP